MNNITSDTLYWIFSTMPQTLAAFIGLVIAGISFIEQRIDDNIEKDSTYTEIYIDVKKNIHSGLKKILYTSVCVLALDFLCLFLNNYIIGLIHYFLVGIACSTLVIINIGTFGYTIIFILRILNPKFLDEIIQKLASEYHDGTIDTSKFIRHFIDFEKEIRRITKNSLSSNEKMNNIYQMINILLSAGILSRQEFNDILIIKKMRNLIIHGGDIKHVEQSIDNSLVTITNKLRASHILTE